MLNVRLKSSEEGGEVGEEEEREKKKEEEWREILWRPAFSRREMKQDVSEASLFFRNSLLLCGETLGERIEEEEEEDRSKGCDCVDRRCVPESLARGEGEKDEEEKKEREEEEGG